ncbi:MAG: hypothetical protein ACFFCM_00840 [Promethearchaeota archaeon]
MQKAQYPWYTAIMKILSVIKKILDSKFQSQFMLAGPKCGIRFFDSYSDEF